MSTVQENIEIIDAAVESEAALTGLSTSTVAEWVGIKQLIAQAFFTFSTFVEKYLSDLDLRGQQVNIGTEEWIADKAREWQDGDPLIVEDGKTRYAVVDPSKCKIVNIAVVSRGGRAIVKAAKANNVPLTQGEDSEMSRWTYYMNKRKPPGIRTAYISQDPDLVWLKAHVQYPGERNLADIKTITEAAVNTYLANIYFNGKININLLRDAMEKAEGIKPGGVTIEFLKVKPYLDVYSDVAVETEAVSGHFAIDPAHPLNNVAQITYEAV